jgi:GH35 family endo-1,4-beta-xylanase
MYPRVLLLGTQQCASSGAQKSACRYPGYGIAYRGRHTHLIPLSFDNDRGVMRKRRIDRNISAISHGFPTDDATMPPKLHIKVTVRPQRRTTELHSIEHNEQTHTISQTMKITNTATTVTTCLSALGHAQSCPPTGTTSLRYEAARKNITIGSGAINPNYLNDTLFSQVLATQFKSLSPENELKWVQLNPSPGHYNWDPLDRLVTFADKNDMVVKGHGLISGCCNPDYLIDVTDPTQFLAAMESHFNATLHRYINKMDRWDVVTEALETMGGGLNHNLFYKVLGPSYIADAFHLARAAAPQAKLFINENLVEMLPQKRQELLDLVTNLVAEGVPIDGVALQMHITEYPLVPGVITEMVNSYNNLGLEVSIAEMDVHTLNNTLETEIYSSVINEALHAGITDISFWGFTDKHLYTWIPGAKPLMFDERYNPKSEFYATHAALENLAYLP